MICSELKRQSLNRGLCGTGSQGTPVCAESDAVRGAEGFFLVVGWVVDWDLKT